MVPNNQAFLEHINHMKCTSCKQEKDIKCFSPARNKKSGCQTHCKECRSEYNKQHYLKNKSRYIEARKKSRQKCVDQVRSFKEENPCTDCGKTYPYFVMEFDHVRGEKKGCIARMVKAGSPKKLQEELKKCELVCCLCHRFRTFKGR